MTKPVAVLLVARQPPRKVHAKPDLLIRASRKTGADVLLGSVDPAITDLCVARGVSGAIGKRLGEAIDAAWVRDGRKIRTIYMPQEASELRCYLRVLDHIAPKGIDPPVLVLSARNRYSAGAVLASGTSPKILMSQYAVGAQLPEDLISDEPPDSPARLGVAGALYHPSAKTLAGAWLSISREVELPEVDIRTAVEGVLSRRDLSLPPEWLITDDFADFTTDEQIDIFLEEARHAA
jgi:hypothetical protein